MSQYDKLDSLIIERVKTQGPVKFPSLHGGDVAAEAAALAAGTGREDFRIIDGRLQILRKRGALRYDTKQGWMLAGEAKS